MFIKLSQRKVKDDASTVVSALGVQPCPASIWMAIFVFLYVGRAAEWLPGMSAFPLSRIVFLICAIVAYRARPTLSKIPIWSLPNARSEIWYLLLAICSVFFSIYITMTLTFIQGAVIQLLALFLLLKVTPTIHDIRRLFVALVMAGLGLSIVTIMTYQGGRAQIKARLMSYDPNDMAYVLVSILPIAFLLMEGASKKVKIVLLSSAAAMGITILLTGSRGGAIGLVVTALALIFRPLGFKSDGSLRSLRFWGIGGRIVLLLALMCIGWLLIPADIRERLTSLLDMGNDYNASLTDNSSRLVIWRRDALAVLSRPVGFGMGNASVLDGKLGGQFKTAHNTLVQSLVELGILGLFLLLRNYFLSWRDLGKLESVAAKARRERKSPYKNNGALYARALKISLLANFVTGFFLSQAFSPILWALIAISAALIGICRIDVDKGKVGLLTRKIRS